MQNTIFFIENKYLIIKIKYLFIIKEKKSIRRAVRRGFQFTLMVVGESGLGKSTLVNIHHDDDDDHDDQDEYLMIMMKR